MDPVAGVLLVFGTMPAVSAHKSVSKLNNDTAWSAATRVRDKTKLAWPLESAQAPKGQVEDYFGKSLRLTSEPKWYCKYRRRGPRLPSQVVDKLFAPLICAAGSNMPSSRVFAKTEDQYCFGARMNYFVILTRLLYRSP